MCSPYISEIKEVSWISRLIFFYGIDSDLEITFIFKNNVILTIFRNQTFKR